MTARGFAWPHGSLAVLAVFVLAALAGCVGPPSGGGQAALPPVDADAQNATVAKQVIDGAILCGLGAGPGTVNPCAPLASASNVIPFAVRPGIATLLIGLTWSPSTFLGEELLLYLETDPYNAALGIGHRYHVAGGTPDLVVRIDTADMAADKWSFATLEETRDLQARVFPAGTVPPTVIVDQAFALHVVAFYGAPAPVDADPFVEWS